MTAQTNGTAAMAVTPSLGPTMPELFETWEKWSTHDMLTRAAAVAHRSGDTGKVARIEKLIDPQPVAALDAVAANYEASTLLAGWRWHAVRAAREAGATWREIAAVTNTTAEAARAEFLAHIERAEQYGHRYTDTAPYRAVLNDDHDTTRSA